MQLSGAVGGTAEGCTDAWASEELLVLLRGGPGAGAELQAWAPGSALRGDPLWSQAVQEAEHGPSCDETQAPFHLPPHPTPIGCYRVVV